MSIYADYEYYLNSFQGDKLEKSEFNKFVKSASEHVRRLTFGRANLNVDNNVKDATCAICEVLADIEKKTINGQFVSSENNDGYSVSYAVGDKSVDDVLLRAINTAVTTYLGDTGLLSWGCD